MQRGAGYPRQGQAGAPTRPTRAPCRCCGREAPSLPSAGEVCKRAVLSSEDPSPLLTGAGGHSTCIDRRPL